MIILVNQFVDVVSPREFEEAFAEVAAFLERQPGIIRYDLLRHLDREDSYVNIAVWTDLDSFRTATTGERFARTAAPLRELCRGVPQLFRSVRSFAAGATAPVGGAEADNAVSGQFR
ncbi:antibiotic biosynthesis monooxygenase [Thermobifida alba]|uniref:Antibiotic biosynthesis monooxygenase n=1 Tax=Thermobifida alba TaxID=53522 RepID=A0ABY4KZH3_THEAE|nr:antibiotic biosynthesis monooxygenase family protein [Thermobifida alba]UPT20832.1 antibiotic biosynthesis monooxygenase [Thermobifida alba]